MSRQWTGWAFATLLGIGMAPAASAEDGFYFGISGGTTSMDVSKADLDADASAILGVDISQSSSLDDSGVSWGAQVGYQWGEHFAAELGYVDFGKAEYKAPKGAPALTATFRSQGPTLAAVGILPLADKFEVTGRAGILFADSRVTARALDQATGNVIGSGGAKAHTQELFFGVGAGWNINPQYALHVGYNKYLDVGDSDETDESDVDQFSVSILFR